MGYVLTDFRDLTEPQRAVLEMFALDAELADVDVALLTKAQGWSLADLADFAEEKFGLGTISEERLLTELLAKRATFTVSAAMFLRDPAKNVRLVNEQVTTLLEGSTL